MYYLICQKYKQIVHSSHQNNTFIINNMFVDFITTNCMVDNIMETSRFTSSRSSLKVLCYTGTNEKN